MKNILFAPIIVTLLKKHLMIDVRGENIMVEPIFSPDESQKPSAPSQKVSPIFGPDDVSVTPPRPASVEPQPLFAPEVVGSGVGSPPQCGLSQRSGPEPLFGQEPSSIRKPVKVSPTVAFAPERDPIVEAYLKKVIEAYPQESAHENVYRSLLAQVIPTSQEKVLVWGEHAVQVAQGAIARAQEIAQQWAQLNVQEALQAVLASAQAHQQRKLGTTEHGLGGLLHRAQALVESVEHGDPVEGKRSLERLASGIRQSLASVPVIVDLCQECTEQLAQLGRCAQVLIPAIQDVSIHGALERRSTVFLGLLQQVQIAQKQVQSQSALLSTELSQIDQAVNVTLPAFGVF